MRTVQLPTTEIFVYEWSEEKKTINISWWLNARESRVDVKNFLNHFFFLCFTHDVAEMNFSVFWENFRCGFERENWDLMMLIGKTPRGKYWPGLSIGIQSKKLPWEMEKPTKIKKKIHQAQPRKANVGDFSHSHQKMMLRHLRGNIIMHNGKWCERRRKKTPGAFVLVRAFYRSFFFCLSSATRSYIHSPFEATECSSLDTFWFFFCFFRSYTKAAKKSII